MCLSTPPLRMCASWRVWAPRSHDEARPLTERTYRSSASRTTHIVTGSRRVPSGRTDASFNSSAAPILSSSSLVHVVISLVLELDQELDRLALVHRPVAVRNLVERAGAVEDAAGFDPTVEDVR